MLIRNAGLYWRIEDVFWGKPGHGKEGKLLGINSDALKSDAVDFAEQCGIYVLYADYSLVYVGQTGIGQQRMLKRLNQHRTDDLADRWNRFSWFGLRWVKANGELSGDNDAFHPSRADVLNHLEALLIYAAEPPRNKQGGKFAAKDFWYLQRRDERLGPSDSTKLEEIYERLKSQA